MLRVAPTMPRIRKIDPISASEADLLPLSQWLKAPCVTPYSSESWACVIPTSDILAFASSYHSVFIGSYYYSM